MFGLGAGALLGGILADRSRNPLLIFAIMETGVGIFAIASPFLITTLKTLLSTADHIIAAALIFFALLPATLMMGATLPILTVALNRVSNNIGWATGKLYSSNTLGAVIGTLSAGIFLPIWMDLDSILFMSGTINLLVASITVFIFPRVT